MSQKPPSARSSKLAFWMAQRSSRNRTFIDRLCRRLVNKATHTLPEDDFMRDDMIDNDLGFDPDELERYQNAFDR